MNVLKPQNKIDIKENNHARSIWLTQFTWAMWLVLCKQTTPHGFASNQGKHFGVWQSSQLCSGFAVSCQNPERSIYEFFYAPLLFPSPLFFLHSRHRVKPLTSCALIVITYQIEKPEQLIYPHQRPVFSNCRILSHVCSVVVTISVDTLLWKCALNLCELAVRTALMSHSTHLAVLYHPS